jgi:NADH:ubiquinone oxidoreductase subunit 3 (subunit A)
MSSLSILFIIVPIVAVALLTLNYFLAIHKPDALKISPFECGFSSFSQTRNPFHIHFFLIGILFLVFDIEIALIYPYVVSAYNNSSYGLIAIIIFLAVLTVGFVFEIGRNALKLRN